MNKKLILDKINDIKTLIINKYKIIKKNIPDILDVIKISCIGFIIFFLFLILINDEIHNQNIFIAIMLIGFLFILTNKCIEILNSYFSYLVEKENIKYMDLNLTGSSVDIGIDGKIIPKTISQSLDDHIEDILNSNILFFMNISNNEYIRANTEQEILNSLIDNVMKFTSQTFKKKISLYYGEQNIDLLIGRRCLIIVSLYVANHNKNIYVSTQTKE